MHRQPHADGLLGPLDGFVKNAAQEALFPRLIACVATLEVFALNTSGDGRN